jgi:hypothetical protein
MREIRTYGSVRGVPGNRHSYRDPSPAERWIFMSRIESHIGMSGADKHASYRTTEAQSG